MRFSQRMGLTPAQPPLQREQVAPETRIRLWNALHLLYWQDEYYNEFRYSSLQELFQNYWHHFFAWSLDELPDHVNDAMPAIRQQFDQFVWHRLLDFLEFTADHGPRDRAERFRVLVNNVLERDNSAYRFVGTELAEITAAAEIESIEDALRATSAFGGVNQHLKVALTRLADRAAPDYRNSIKESISAVEAVAQVLTGDHKATLGAALTAIEANGRMHGALKASLSSLYGYTSDADGIRHAMLEESTLTFADAKFMLVACTAFINYLLTKAAEARM